MALRTPPLQLRSQFGRDWGNYANAFNALPNQSGNVLSAAHFAVLEVGDTAWALSTKYVCVSPGTVGGGNALWMAAPGGFEGVRGFSATDYLEAAVTDYQGDVSGFSVCALCRPRLIDQEAVIIRTASDFFNNSGWMIGLQGGAGFYFLLGDGVTSTQLNAGPHTAPDIEYRAGKLFLIHGTYDGVDAAVYLNGNEVISAPQAYAPSGIAPQIGIGPFGNGPADDYDILGVAYIERQLSTDEVFEHWSAVASAQAWVPGAITWDKINGGRLNPGWPALNGGAANFAVTGTLADTRVPAVWF